MLLVPELKASLQRTEGCLTRQGGPVRLVRLWRLVARKASVSKGQARSDSRDSMAPPPPSNTLYSAGSGTFSHQTIWWTVSTRPRGQAECCPGLLPWDFLSCDMWQGDTTGRTQNLSEPRVPQMAYLLPETEHGPSHLCHKSFRR
jgi:hypothetical protein